MIIIVNRSVPLNGQKLKRGLNTVNCDYRDPATINQLRIYRQMGAISFTESLPGDTVKDGKDGKPQVIECHCCPDSHYAKDKAANEKRNGKRRGEMKVAMKKLADMSPKDKESAMKNRLKKLADVKARRNHPQA